jgi:3-isopropylmalate/(R)-2-methylmalate dehydratase small subunit
MNQVKAISGRGIALVGNDIDTDRIIPARFLRCVTFDGLGAHVFADDRAQFQGQHPFDQPHYQGATILVVNRNFGCGSSREHAPQAIAKWGIQAIVGESFAEIFFGNCVALGLPCVTASSSDLLQLQDKLSTHSQSPITIDLENLALNCEELSMPITLAEGPRQMFVTGTWDACGQLVAQVDRIRSTAAQLPYLAFETANA